MEKKSEKKKKPDKTKKVDTKPDTKPFISEPFYSQMPKEARVKMRKLLIKNNAAWSQKPSPLGKVQSSSMRETINNPEGRGEFTNDCLAPNKHVELLKPLLKDLEGKRIILAS